jgi:hypothetical protein
VHRRLLAALLLAAAVLVGPALPAGAQDPSTTTTVTQTTAARHLPRTDLEAEDRGGDDEGFGAAWLIGSGVACAALIVVGGLWLQRKAAQQDREG